MITTAKEYDEMRYRIYDANYPSEALLLPSDEFIYEHYDGYSFTEDDFCCSA